MIPTVYRIRPLLGSVLVLSLVVGGVLLVLSPVAAQSPMPAVCRAAALAEPDGVPPPAPPVVQPTRAEVAALDCPPGVTCTTIPAYYGLNDVNNPFDYGNYAPVDRYAFGIDINYVVLHNTEEIYATTIDIFQDPLKYVSVHYVIDVDGSITRMVPDEYIGWHGQNSYIYDHAIGIEHIGYAIDGAEWYTDAMYESSARLIQYLAAKHDIPLDRAHIIGHDELAGRTPRHQRAMHWDPGPFWDWDRYMNLIGAPPAPANTPADSTIVTIDPDFATNQPPLTYCYPGSGCRGVPPQGSNFVYAYTAPDFGAPLVREQHAGGASTDAAYWGNKLLSGQQYYRVARQGEWDGVYFGGQVAWFHNPGGDKTTPADGVLVTPRAGLASIPAYGMPYPDAIPPEFAGLPRFGYRYPSDYAYAPSDPQTVLYNIPAGQVYVAGDLVTGQYVGMPFADPATAIPYIINGQTAYYQIFYNHRMAFVRASDVEVVDCTVPEPEPTAVPTELPQADPRPDEPPTP